MLSVLRHCKGEADTAAAVYGSCFTLSLAQALVQAPRVGASWACANGTQQARLIHPWFSAGASYEVWCIVASSGAVGELFARLLASLVLHDVGVWVEGIRGDWALPILWARRLITHLPAGVLGVGPMIGSAGQVGRARHWGS